MHRSGTSVVSGLLHKSGIFMGDERSFIPKPNPENPEGFFENYDFRTINDEVLEKNGYVVKDWHTALPDLNASFFTRRKINKTLRSYHKKHSKWGWKDPRQMLTLRIWLSSLRKLKLLNKVRIVFVYRNPFSVCKSMQKRGNLESQKQGLDLWKLYNETAIADLGQFNTPTLYFSFEKLREKPERILDKLAQFSEVDIPLSIFNSFFSDKHVRSQQFINIDEIKDDKTRMIFSFLEKNHV
jgi:hypothetical protein